MSGNVAAGSAASSGADLKAIADYVVQKMTREAEAFRAFAAAEPGSIEEHAARQAYAHATLMARGALDEFWIEMTRVRRRRRAAEVS